MKDEPEVRVEMCIRDRFDFVVFCSDLFGDCIDFFFSGEDLVQCGPVKEDQRCV